MHFASTNENIGILENGLATLPPETLPQTPKRGGKNGEKVNPPCIGYRVILHPPSTRRQALITDSV